MPVADLTGAATITPDRMQSGDTISDLQGLQSIKIDKVESIEIQHGGRAVPVWWIKGTDLDTHKTVQTVSVPRQQWYLLRQP